MTVKELVAELRKLPQDHTVEAYSESAESFFELIKVALDLDFPEEKRVFIDLR